MRRRKVKGRKMGTCPAQRLMLRQQLAATAAATLVAPAGMSRRAMVRHVGAGATSGPATQSMAAKAAETEATAQTGLRRGRRSTRGTREERKTAAGLSPSSNSSSGAAVTVRDTAVVDHSLAVCTRRSLHVAAAAAATQPAVPTPTPAATRAVAGTLRPPPGGKRAPMRGMIADMGSGSGEALVSRREIAVKAETEKGRGAELEKERAGAGTEAGTETETWTEKEIETGQGAEKGRSHLEVAGVKGVRASAAQ